MKTGDPRASLGDEAVIPAGLLPKWQALTRQLLAARSAVVAYSGGVDSSLLAYTAARVLGERMVAVTLDSTFEAPDTLRSAAAFAALHGIPHRVMAYDPLQNAEIRANPANRCYACKTQILSALWQYARQHAFQVVLDGQNADDLHDHRPGNRAIEESGTLSPLAGSGLSKAEIRQLSQALGLSTWDRPSAPCLATRIPYGVPITPGLLSQVARGEQYLQDKGFRHVRVRCHGDLARIEVDPSQVQMALDLRAELVSYFKHIGFIHVTLDLQGCRSGSMNEGLPR